MANSVGVCVRLFLVLYVEFKNHDHEKLVFNNSRLHQVKKRETEKNSTYKSWFPPSLLLYLCEYLVLCARRDFNEVTNLQ